MCCGVNGGSEADPVLLRPQRWLGMPMLSARIGRLASAHPGHLDAICWMLRRPSKEDICYAFAVIGGEAGRGAGLLGWFGTGHCPIQSGGPVPEKRIAREPSGAWLVGTGHCPTQPGGPAFRERRPRKLPGAWLVETGHCSIQPSEPVRQERWSAESFGAAPGRDWTVPSLAMKKPGIVRKEPC